MGKIMTIVQRDLREALRSRATYFYLVFLLLVSFPYMESFSSIIDSVAQGGEAAEVRLAAGTFLDSISYMLPLIFTMLLCSVLAAYSVAMDKAKRNMESLLATPLSLRQIWLGKSLAVALPGVVIAILVSILAILALNLAVAVPKTGEFIVPGALSLLTALIIVPLMAMAVVSLVILLQLITSNPRLANLAFVGMFLAIYFISITGFGTSWNFAVIYLVTIACLVLVNVLLARLLTRERVILSSKA